MPESKRPAAVADVRAQFHASHFAITGNGGMAQARFKPSRE
jgi:hypothetical protein